MSRLWGRGVKMNVEMAGALFRGSEQRRDGIKGRGVFSNPGGPHRRAGGMQESLRKVREARGEAAGAAQARLVKGLRRKDDATTTMR